MSRHEGSVAADGHSVGRGRRMLRLRSVTSGRKSCLPGDVTVHTISASTKIEPAEPGFAATKPRAGMPNIRITRAEFLKDHQGRTFADVVNDPKQPFDRVLEFFNQSDHQRRMEESELHHDRSPLAGVVRELESVPEIDRFLATAQIKRNNRFRQAIGVLVRMIMERRGWEKTGRKGSLGVRASGAARTPAHNTGGLAFWFLRAERYELKEGMPFRSVRQRCSDLEAATPKRKKSRT